MAGIEHALDSADKCSKDDIGKDSGADPNACAGNDLRLITTSPLSEMVWSQQEGLSLQDVACSIGEKKASLLWNTESFRIVISSPKCADCGESSNSKDLAGGDFNHFRLKPNCEGNFFDSVLPGSPRNTSPSKEGSLIRIYEHESRNFEDLKTSNKMEVGLDKEISRNNQSAEKEVENNTSSVDTLRTNTHKVDTIQDKDLFSGPDNPDQNAEHLKELGSDIPLASESNIIRAHSHIKESDQMETCHTSSLAIQPADQGCLLTKPGSQKASSSPNTAECRYDSDLNTTVETVECTNGWKTQHPTRLNPVERKCYSEVQMVGFGVQQPSEAQDESFRAPHKGKSVFISSVGNLSYSNTGEGKQQAIGDSEESSSSKVSEDSHDSVESCNSKRLVSPGKRARSYDLKMSVVNKKLKNQICEGSSSDSFLRQESSFMNWVSTITNGFSRFTGATPLAFVPPPSPSIERNPNFLSLSHAESKDIGITCRNTGFKSLFQSLYLPGFKAKRDMNGYRPRDAAAKELQVESEQFGYSSSQVHCKRMEFNLHGILPTVGDRVNCVSKYHSRSEQINASSLNIVGRDELHNEVSMPAERLNKNVDKVKKNPSTNGNVSPGDSSFPENPKCDFGQTGNHSNVGSTSSSPRNNSQSPFGGKGAGALLAVESSSELVSHNRSALLQNLWITRFSPKVSSNKPNASQHMQGMDLSAETSDPQFQNNAATSKGQGCSENSCLPPPVQSQMSGIDANKLESLKTGNQKRKSNLNPILPSPKFQKTEPIVSTFAKRLDILRNPKLPKVPDNVSLTDTTCLFCGGSAHGTRACS